MSRTMQVEQTAGVTSAKPVWFGPADRPLFGWVHLPPEAKATGTVVLCPPLGIEALCVYFTYRVLADRLAEVGLAVIRFDYDGTGDSAGAEDDPDRVAAWVRSAGEALELAASLGAPRVGLVGMRMGALLGAEAVARRGGVHALVLWDPCASGRTFLREQRAFRMVSLGGDDADGGVETPGLRFDAGTVADLERLDLTALEDNVADRILVLEHPERVRSTRLARRLETVGAESTEAVGQGDLLDPPQQAPAYESVAKVVRWLAQELGGPPVPVHAGVAGSAVADLSGAGHRCRERTVEIPPAGLFGIITEPSDADAAASRPTVVFVDEGNTPHIGQSRMWVDLAREWADLGYRSIRWDLSANGDSPARPGQTPHEARTPEAVDDVVEVATSVAPPEGGDVVLIGLCAGAYQSMEVALAHRVRGVVLINLAVTFPPIERDQPGRSGPRDAVQRSKPWFQRLAGLPLEQVAARQAPARAEEWRLALETGSWPMAVASRRPGVPEPVWSAVRRLLLDNTPVDTFRRLAARGIETVAVCGREDLTPVTLGAAAELRRLEASGAFRLEVLDELDHAALMADQRRQLKATLTGILRSRFAGAAASASAGTSAGPGTSSC